MILEEGLIAAGIIPLESHGGFFLMAKLPVELNIQQLAGKSGDAYDWEYCRQLAYSHGIIGIPASPFISSTSSVHSLGPMARFAFCKKDITLQEARNKLKQNSLLHDAKMNKEVTYP